MTFDWDEANIDHIKLHGISPEQAESLLLGPYLELGFEWHDDELRVRVAGETRDGRILELVSTDRGEDTRVVSAWSAPRDIRLKYLRWRVQADAG